MTRTLYGFWQPEFWREFVDDTDPDGIPWKVGTYRLADSGKRVHIYQVTYNLHEGLRPYLVGEVKDGTFLNHQVWIEDGYFWYWNEDVPCRLTEAVAVFGRCPYTRKSAEQEYILRK